MDALVKSILSHFSAKSSLLFEGIASQRVGAEPIKMIRPPASLNFSSRSRVVERKVSQFGTTIVSYSI